MSSLLRSLVLLATAHGVAPVAHAVGVSADVEMVRPTLGPAPGLDTSRVLPARHLVVGVLAHGESRPVVLLAADGDHEGSPVAARLALHAGARVGLGRRLEVSGVLPIAWQYGTDDPGNADGAWVGDLEIAVRVAAVASPTVALAPRVELALPTGDEQAWMGEGAVRPGAGLAAEVAGLGPVRLMGDAAARWHPERDLARGYSGGPTLQVGCGARLDAGPASASVVYTSRTVLRDTAGEGEDGSEILASVAGEPDPRFRLESLFGYGLRGGVGVPAWRVGLGVRYTFRPRAAAPVPLRVDPDERTEEAT